MIMTYTEKLKFSGEVTMLQIFPFLGGGRGRGEGGEDVCSKKDGNIYHHTNKGWLIPCDFFVPFSHQIAPTSVGTALHRSQAQLSWGNTLSST